MSAEALSVKLVSRAETCVLCGASPCAKACPSASYVPVHEMWCSWCTPPRMIREGIQPITHGCCDPCGAFYFPKKAK